MGSVRALLAHTAPAGGAPTEDLVPAVIVAVIATAVLAVAGWAHRARRFSGLRLLAAVVGRIPPLRGLPKWAALPIGTTTVSLLVAVFGFYWDVSTHIDNGRDEGPFANPSHFFILAGLAGIALAGYFAVLLAGDEERPPAVRLREGWSVPVGGVLLLGCGVIALAGFPLDDVWHRVFGQDVTLWGPTHIQMVAGASLSTLAMWVLYIEAGGRNKAVEIPMAAAFLVGLATLQAEFDFGVPQFRLLYQPVLLAIGAGIGLVAARIRLGAGAALAAALGFILIRAALTALVGPALDRIEPHFPLLLAEALVVEAVALAVPLTRPLRLGALAGLGVGTVGFAAEWAWSHIWMPNPWQPSMLPEALPWVAAAGTAAGVVGALVGRALCGGEVARRPVPKPVAALAAATLVAAVAWPLPVNDGGGITASVSLRELSSEPRTVEATLRVDPPEAPEDAAWFTVVAWQGAEWQDRHSVIDHLEQVGPGVWRTTQPVPVHGDWKAVARLHEGHTLAALPIYLPHDEAIPAEEVPAPPSFQREFVSDKELLQREFTGGPTWLTAAAYATILAIAVGWLWLMAWGLTRLVAGLELRRADGEVRGGAPAEERAGV